MFIILVLKIISFLKIFIFFIRHNYGICLVDVLSSFYCFFEFKILNSNFLDLNSKI